MLGVCALQELFGNDLWFKMAPVLPQCTAVDKGGISWTLGSRACIISECAFLLITCSLSPLISYGPVFILTPEWEVPNLGKIKMLHFKFEKFNSLVCIIL